MSDSVRRVVVHLSDDPGSVVVDLALPGGIEVAELIPAIMDLVDGADAESPAGWQLSRIGGPALDVSRTLTENGVHDGELLMLSSTEIAPPARRDPDDFRCDSDDPARRPRVTRILVALWISAAGAVAVGWAGLLRDGPGRSIPAALLTIGAAAAVLPYRHRRDPMTATTSAVIVVLLAAALGLLAVPSGPGAANVLLAAAAGGAAALTMLRWTRVGTIPLVAVATFAAVLAISVVAPTLWPMPAVVVGAVLATTAMAVLAVAPRLSISLSGLTPTLDADDEECRAALPDDAQMVRGNAILTGLLIGAVAAATLGAAVVALRPGPAAPWWSGVLFITAVAVALLLQARTHADALRRSVLLGSGICGATVAFLCLVAESPGHATVPGALAVAVGLTVVGERAGASPLARRAADVVEYLALAALLPLACWIAGVYGLVRGLALW